MSSVNDSMLASVLCAVIYIARVGLGPYKYCIDGFHGHFTMGTGGHYITMLPADWSIFTSHDQKDAMESIYSIR